MLRQLSRTQFLTSHSKRIQWCNRRLFSTSKPTTYRTNTRLVFLLGLSATTLCGILAFPTAHTIYCDANASERNEREYGDNGDKRRVEVDGLELAMLVERMALELGIKEEFNFNDALAAAATSTDTVKGAMRVDSLIFPSNSPCEDFISVGSSVFSPTLDYAIFGIYDGHNGFTLARTISNNLPEIVTVRLADLYSQHARISSPSGMDLSTGYPYANDTRNPGDPPNPTPPPEEVDDAIKKAFVDFDNALVHGCAQLALGLDVDAYRAVSGGLSGSSLDRHKRKFSRSDALSILEHAYAGSCVLLGMYNTYDRSLRIALTGDSRAVLGRRAPAPKNLFSTSKHMYEVHALSEDQNASNKTEASRLTALHPDEPELLKNGRVLGWGPARAFGDGVMKWSMEVQRLLHEEYLGDRPREAACKSPPYFTAEPVITTFSGVQRGDFAVLASDGLWDCLGSEEVVGLVGQWLEEWGVKERVGDREVTLPPKAPEVHGFEAFLARARARSNPLNLQQAQTPGGVVITASSDDTFSANTMPISPSELPVIYPNEYKDTTKMYKYWKAEKRFICAREDKDNVAAHLVRNALGGADRDLSEALFKIRGRRGRRFRDDISVLVVFFD